MTLKCQGLVNTASLITSNLGLSFKCNLVQVSQFNKQQQIIVTLTPSREFKTVCMESSAWQFFHSSWGIRLWGEKFRRIM